MTFDQFLHDWVEKSKEKYTDADEFQKAYSKEYDRLLVVIKKNRWRLGFKDRGLGHGDWAVIVKVSRKDIVVVECPCRAIAEHIIESHKLCKL